MSHSKLISLPRPTIFIKHAEAFGAALCDQSSLQQQHNSDLAKIAYLWCQQQSKTPDSDTKPCSGCSSHNHGQPNFNDHCAKCLAWGKKCLHCNVLNHFASVCHEKCTASANALIANVHYHQNSDIFTVNSNDQISEIPATLSVSPSEHETNTEHKINIFPDCGASFCLTGPTHLHKLNLNTNQLIPFQNTAVGGRKLKCHGWLLLVLIPLINPFTYVKKWIEFTSAARAALKQKSYYLSHIPCLKPLQWRLQPYQLPRHHSPDHLNSHILPPSKTYWNWKIIYQTNLAKQHSTEHHHSLLWILCQHISPMPNQLHNTPLYLSQYTGKRSLRNH